MTKMLLDLEFGKARDHLENVTSIIEKLADRKDMCTPHNDDEKFADMFRDTVFVDDVNGGNELDNNLVIEAGKTEKRQGGSSRRDGSTRKRATEGTRTIARGLSAGKSRRTSVRICSRPPHRSRLLKLLVAGCAKGQRQAKHFRIGIFDVSRAYFYAPVTRLASYRSAFIVRETLRRIGRKHTPSSWSRSGSRGAERPAATSCTRRGTSR